LKSCSWKALLSCPDCRKIRFARVLPNCVLIDFVKRKPVALAKFYKNFAIDEQGIFFYPNYLEVTGLPVIYGLETKIFGPKPGVRYRSGELNIALNVIKEFKSNKAFQGFALKRIDVANAESAGFFILVPRQAIDYTKSNPQVEWIGFEVRIGQGNIREKMMVLGGLVTQAAKEWANIKYIDLRFKEPVIKLTKENNVL
ncbi:MAG: cell division protein FtsQ/DivIB, partial [Candidatus Omnitrophica bacterium]|nr:cell division protein FtsQ/DivIB [Candidatus Omnitrophota bacterium]